MKRWLLVCMTVAVVFGSSVASVWADDLFPAPFRGGPRTTSQGWHFYSSGNPSVPDEFSNNPNGFASATATPGSLYEGVVDGRLGVWDLINAPGGLNITVPNFPDQPDWQKDVWVQVTYKEEAGQPVVTVDGHPTNIVYTQPMPGLSGWFFTAYETILPYNPQFEVVNISGPVDVCEVIVDTRCAVPEPSTFALLAMGAFGLAAFVWRRKRAV